MGYMCITHAVFSTSTLRCIRKPKSLFANPLWTRGWISAQGQSSFLRGGLASHAYLKRRIKINVQQWY